MRQRAARERAEQRRGCGVPAALLQQQLCSILLGATGADERADEQLDGGAAARDLLGAATTANMLENSERVIKM